MTQGGDQLRLGASQRRGPSRRVLGDKQKFPRAKVDRAFQRQHKKASRAGGRHSVQFPHLAHHQGGPVRCLKIQNLVPIC